MSEVSEHSIQIEKQARYHTLGNLEQANHLVVVLHGYGQLSNYFIEKFRGLDDSFFVLAIEGLHRFYLKGSSGRVGASWMTKECRETDIQDNQKYLEKVIAQFSTQSNIEKITLLGFSQGGATAARYFYSGNNSINHLILWASIFPPDLLIENEIKTEEKRNSRQTFILGTQDQFFDSTAQSELIFFYKSHHFETHQFEGLHDIDLKTLKTIIY